MCRGQWSEVLDGRASRATRDAVDAHMERCASCAKELPAYQALFGRLRSVEPRLGPAPKFVFPAEFPGVGDRRSAASPWWKRTAAAAVILGGLVLSHSMTFKYARETGATRSSNSGAVTPEPPLASAFLPSALRDNVDTTDLLVRSALYMPESAADRAKAVLLADMGRLDLDLLTAKLRSQGVERHPEHGVQITRYLRAADEFRAGLCNIMAQPTSANLVNDLHDIASRADVARAVEPMRPVVASLAAGTSVMHLPGVDKDPRLVPLHPDERVFIGAKQARVEGRYQAAVAGYQRFDHDMSRSPFAPLARYMMAESLYRGGDLARAFGTLQRCNMESVESLSPCDPLQPLVILRGTDASGGMIFRVAQVTSTAQLGGAVRMGVIQRTTPAAQIPNNLSEFCQRRGLVPMLRQESGGRTGIMLLRDGKSLSSADYPKLFESAVRLATNPTLSPDMVEPSEIDDQWDRLLPPAVEIPFR